MQLHNHFETIKAVCKAIKRYVLDNRESFKVDLSNKKWYSIICKERGCRFGIWVFKSSKEEVSITIFKPYTYSPTVLRLRHALPSGTRGLMPHDHSLSLAPLISEPSALLLLSFFLSFRSSYLGLPIERAFALLLMRHRSTIDRVRDILSTTTIDKHTQFPI
jgi:hypothetical protein